MPRIKRSRAPPGPRKALMRNPDSITYLRETLLRLGREVSSSCPYARAEAVLLTLETGSTSKRADNWVARLHAYESFFVEHQRPPRRSTRGTTPIPETERRLGEWARRERDSWDRRTPYQRLRLSVSPAFAIDPNLQRWMNRAERYDKELLQLGTPTKPSRRWYYRQLGRLRQGRLSPQRAMELARISKRTSKRPIRHSTGPAAAPRV